MGREGGEKGRRRRREKKEIIRVWRGERKGNGEKGGEGERVRGDEWVRGGGIKRERVQGIDLRGRSYEICKQEELRRIHADSPARERERGRGTDDTEGEERRKNRTESRPSDPLPSCTSTLHIFLSFPTQRGTEDGAGEGHNSRSS